MKISSGTLFTGSLQGTWSSKSFKALLVLLIFLGVVEKNQAATASSGITYTGKILDSQDAPVTASSVIFTITVYDPSGKCWLYTEQRNLDLSQTAGTFSFEIGSSDASTLYGAAPSFNNQSSGGPKDLAELFSNKRIFTGLGAGNGCTGSYDPTASADPNEGRLLSVYFRIGVSGADQAIPPMRVTPVPMAMQALSVNGYGTGELLRVDQATVASAGIANNALSVAQYTEFWSLMNKASTSYLPVTGDIGVSGGNNKITSILGQALPAGPATNGQVLVSNGTSWVLGSLSTGSVTSVSGTAPIAVGGTASAPIISLPAATSSANGYLTSSDWNVFNSKHSSALSSGNVWVGNASGLASEVSLSGDATMDNAGVLTLKNTGTAGIYGSASLVPVITTDAQGRVTGVTTAAPLDATKLPLAGGTMTGTLNMGGQDMTNAGNISMANNKSLGLSSNATDPVSPAAGQVWYNSTSNLIKFYDGSSVQSLGVAGAGISSLNGLTSGAQTFAIGTSGNSPAFSSASSTHTLNIPLASTAGVTSGLISKADYDTFNTKLGAVSNTASLAATKIWIGNASGVAQEFALSGDATMTSGGVVSVDKTQSAAASKILQLTASSVAVTKGIDIGGAGTGVAHLLYPNTATDTTLTFPSSAGSVNQFLQTDGAGNLSWNSPAATLPGLASTQVWVGNTSGAAAAVSLSGDIASITNAGVVTANKTTTAQANKLLALDGTGVAASMGNQLNGSTSGSVTLQAAGATTNYSLAFPATQGGAGQTLANNGSGVFSWITPLTSSTGFVNGGNSFGADASLGTNDNFNLYFKTNNTTQMTLFNTGNLSIGTPFSGAPLQIGKDGLNMGGNAYVVAGIDDSTSKGVWIGYDSSAEVGIVGADSANLTTANNLAFLTNTGAAYTEKMRITSDGNVGIGTTTPQTSLDVSLATGGVVTLSRNNTSVSAGDTIGKIQFWNNDSNLSTQNIYANIEVQASQNIMTDAAAGNLIFKTTGVTTGGAPVERMRISSIGNVGIGTSTPLHTLTVDGDGAFFGSLTLTNTGGNSGYVSVKDGTLYGIGLIADSSTGNAFLFGPNHSGLIVNSTGNAGIGTTFPATKLDVNGSVKVGTDTTACSNTIQGAIRLNGTNLEYCNGTAWTGGLSSSGGTLSGGLTISSGGETITAGGLDVNSTGITNAGSITGVGSNLTGSSAMTIASGGTAQNLTLSSSTTGSVNLSSGNGTQLSVLDGGANTVNYVTVKGAATGGSPVIGTDGSDANINLTLTPKGSGNTIFSSGNVGIGTTSPGTKLEVAGALRLSSSTTDSFISPQGSSVPTKINVPLYNPGNFGQIFAMGLPSTAPSTARAIMLTDARTSTHQATLAVLSPDESNVLGLSFDGSNTTGYLKTTSTDLGLVVNNTTEAIHMTSAGNVGIGTTAPTAALQVESNTTSTPQLVVKQNNNADWARITMNANGNSWLLSVGAPGTGQSDLFNIYSTTLSANVISATATGNVGINTNNPQYTLDVNGSARATGSIAAWSDIRVKKNIQPLDNSLDRILNLKGVSFEWRHDEFPDKKFKEGRDIGVIAQNVETQFPEIVETGKDGYKSVAYQKLVAPLIEAVKTLYSRIMGIERYQTTQDGEIASIKAQKADKVELETIKAENALLKANDVAKDQKIHKLERENAIIKAYLCGKDQNATFCR